MIDTLNLFLVFFFLPTQLGLHFWPNFAYLQGFRVDYLSPTLYFTDLLLIIYVIRHFRFLILFFQRHLHTFLLAILIVVLNLLFSLSPLNTLFWYLRLILYLLFVFILKIKSYPLNKILVPLLFGVFIQIILAFFQTVQQSSLNGWWYFLGERRFSLSTPQVAKVDLFGHLFIRPYATFSHPNAFAGYLFLTFLLVDISSFKKNFLIKLSLFFGILLSGSKAALLVIILLTLNLTLYLPLSLSIIFSLLFLLPQNLISTLPYFISSRYLFLNHSLTLFFQYPFFGVGYGSYLVGLTHTLSSGNLLPSTLQPVHHFPLLLIAEFGSIGIILLILLLKSTFKKFRNNSLMALTLILLLAVLDHYFYTLPQTKLLLLITLSYLV